MLDDDRKQSASGGSSGGSKSGGSQKQSNLEKAKAYKDPDGDGTRAGYTERQEAAQNAATKGTSAEFLTGLVPDYLNAGGGSQLSQANGAAGAGGRKNTIRQYLSSGETSSEQTSKYLEETSDRAKSAGTEKEQGEWLDMQAALEKQLKEDQKREKRENSFLYKTFDKLLKAEPGNQKALPQAIPMNSTAAELAARQEPAGEEETNTAEEEEEERETEDETGKEDTRELQELYNAAAWKWNATHDPKDKADMDALEARIQEAEAAQAPKTQTSDKLDQLLTDYNRVHQQYTEAAGYATDPLGEAALKPLADENDRLKQAIMEENQSLGNDLYYGLGDEERAKDAASGWLGGRAASTTADAGALLLAADSVFYKNDEIRELQNRYDQAALAWLATFDPKYQQEMEEIEPQLEAAKEAAANDTATVLGETGEKLLGGAQDFKEEADRNWENAMSGLSETERFVAELGKGAADLMTDLVLNVAAPGLGTAAMYSRAGGSEALEQLGKEENTNDKVVLATLTGSANAWLSTKLVGGMDKVYGKSLLGSLTDQMIENASPAVQGMMKTFLNSEGVEEGLEDILNHAADKILGLDGSTPLDWDEVKQDALVGYILGVFMNGLSAGIDYTPAKRQALVDEAIEFAMSGMSPQEAVEQAMETTKKDITVKAAKQEAPTDVRAAAEQLNQIDEQASQKTTPEPAPQQNEETYDLAGEGGYTYTALSPESETTAETEPVQAQSQPVTAQTPQQQDVIDILLNPTGENGKVSNSQAQKILNDPALLQALYEVTNGAVDLREPIPSNRDASARKAIKDAASLLLGETDGSTGQGTNASGNTPTPRITYEQMDGAHKAAYNKAHTHSSVNPAWDNRVLSDIAQPASDYLKDKDPVSQINGNRFSGETTSKGLVDKVVDFFQKHIGNRVFSNKLGEDVIIDRRGFKSDTMHGFGDEKAATFEAIPEVLKDGEILSVHDGTVKDAGYVIGGKITLDGKDAYVFCVVTINGENNKFYLHEVADENGTLYYLKNDDTAGKNNSATVEFITERDEASTSSPTVAEPSSEPNANAPEDGGQNSDGPTVPQDSGTVNTEAGENAQNGGNPQNAAQNGAGSQGGSQSTNIPPETAEANTESSTGTETNQTAMPPQNRSSGSGKEKISQFFSNTLLKREDAGEYEPISYRTKSDVETMMNAVNRLNENQAREMEGLMTAGAWTDEQVHMARSIGKALLADARKTGDTTAYRMWRDLESSKIRETARGLRAVALEPNAGAEAVLRESEHTIEDIRNDKNAKVPEEDLKKAQDQTDEVVQKMLGLEEKQEQAAKENGEKPATQDDLKNAYLDLAEKINVIRNTGLLQDAGKNRAAQQKKLDKLNTKFRRMLADQDMDFIQRFVACQAAGITEDLKYKGKQDIGHRINTFQKLAQLTGTGTWLRNFSGNASFGLIDLMANNNPVTLISDQIVSAATGKRSTGFERGVLEKGTLAAFKKNAERSILEVAANIDLAESEDTTKYDMSRVRTFNPNGNWVNRFLSRWEQLNGYMLTSSDQAFRGGIENSSEAAIRRANERHGNKVSDAEIEETAGQVADYRLFQNQGVSADMADSARDLFNRAGIGGKGKTHEGGFGLGTALMPYTKVPTNIGVKSLEFSPLGAVKGLAEMIKVGTDAKRGKATMAQQNQAVTDFGRGVTGTMLIAGLAQLMKNAPFFKDWEAEDDKDVKAQNKAEGKSGMQFNIDMMIRAADGDQDTTWRTEDRTVDISSIEPLNQLLTTASLISEGMGAGEAFARSAKDNFMSLPSVSALSNIENTIKYTDTPDELGRTLLNTGASTVGGIAGGFIPAPIRHIAAATDKMQRDTSGNNAAERALNQIKSGIPGLRETLPVKTDAFGREVSAGDTATRLLTTYGGNRYTQVNQGEVSREIGRIREETGTSLMPSRSGPSSVTIGDEKVKLTAEERKEWKDSYGKAFERTMQIGMRNQVYQDAPATVQAQIGSELESYVKDGTRDTFAKDHGLQYEGKYDDVRKLDNPVSYLTTKKRFDLATKAGHYDVVDTLLGPIGNMTDGDREMLFDKDSEAKKFYSFLTPGKDGYKVSDAETFASYQEGVKANAEERGVTSPSGEDVYQEIRSGYKAGDYSDSDVDALMRYHYTQSDGDESYNAAKGRYSAYSAMRDNNFSVDEALIFWDVLDADGNGYIKKAERKKAFGRLPKDRRAAVERSFDKYYGTKKKK